MVFAGFIGISEKSYLKHRIGLLTTPIHKKTSPWMVGAIVAVCAILFVGSYGFIVQPAALPSTEEDPSMVVVTPENAWLVPVGDGQYEIWVDGNLYYTIPSSCITVPPFDQLPIKND